MGMAYEYESIGGITGIPIDLSIGEKRIIIRVPEGVLSRLKIYAKRSDVGLFQLFFELSTWLEQVRILCPSHLNDATLKEILTSHIQYNNNAIEKDMLFNIKQCEEFRQTMKIVLNRVGPHIFKNDELIALLESE